MNTDPIVFSPPTNAPAWQRWLLFSPLARIAIFVALAFVIGFINLLALHYAGLIGPHVTGLPHAVGDLLTRCVPTLGAYMVLVLLVERRRPRELAWRDLLPQGTLGLALGVTLVSAVMGTLWLTGSYHVTGANGHVEWLGAILVLGIGAGISEEIVLRGVLFRIVEEGLGTWVALVVSALVFGAIHLGNPNATLWSGIAIAVEAGVLLALLYALTRSLWTCVGLHAAWNVMEGPVYGTSVSGLPPHGWLQSTTSGPAWLSGGPFGPEASVVTLGWCMALSTLLLVLVVRRRGIVPPAWRRLRRT